MAALRRHIKNLHEETGKFSGKTCRKVFQRKDTLEVTLGNDIPKLSTKKLLKLARSLIKVHNLIVINVAKFFMKFCAEDMHEESY